MNRTYPFFGIGAYATGGVFDPLLLFRSGVFSVGIFEKIYDVYRSKSACLRELAQVVCMTTTD
jgi:hypothetical protein